MKQYSRKEFEDVLVRNGYKLARQSDGHNIWRKDGKNVVVSRHKLNFMISRRLIKENALEV